MPVFLRYPAKGPSPSRGDAGSGIWGHLGIKLTRYEATGCDFGEAPAAPSSRSLSAALAAPNGEDLCQNGDEFLVGLNEPVAEQTLDDTEVDLLIEMVFCNMD